jgi:hypothetical protein
LLDETNIHVADLLDAYQLSETLFVQHVTLRRGYHRAGDGVGAERGH